MDILCGDATSLTAEVAGEMDDGAEFLCVRASDGVVEAHQVKRQKGSANGWTVKSLHDLGIWANARLHVVKGREFHFASATPAPKLEALADRSRRSASLAEFVKNGWLTKELKPQFDELAQADIYGSPAVAWELLRSMHFHWLDEESLVSHNAAMSGVLLEGASGRLASVGLGDLVVNNLGVQLSAAIIDQELTKYGLQRSASTRSEELRQSAASITDKWRASVQRELLSPAIVRVEAAQLVRLSKDQATPVTFLVGHAGGGKSATLMQATDELLDKSVPVLGFRLDRLGEFGTTQELGEQLGLDTSPVSALALAANGEHCVLVVDQLDAVSLASGGSRPTLRLSKTWCAKPALFPTCTSSWRVANSTWTTTSGFGRCGPN